jgi:hypothetical protein
MILRCITVARVAFERSNGIRARASRSEDAVFLGDASFLADVASLASATTPLVEHTDGARIDPLATRASFAAIIRLTPAGRAVIDGASDHVHLNGIDRWYGGVHMDGADAAWRWDETRRALRRSV